MNTSNQTAICNMALGGIGVSSFINNINEASQQAAVCMKFWDAVIEQVLQAFPWGFAMIYSPLQVISLTIYGWLYAYGCPADCVQARLIVPEPANFGTAIPAGYTSSPSFNFWDEFKNLRKIPFELIANVAGGGLAICTNQSNAVLAYTGRVTTIPLWTPAAVNALVWLLASKIAAPLAANPKEAAMTAGAAYQNALLEAGALSLNEGVEKQNPESELILSRR